MKKDTLIIIAIILFSATMYALTLRGAPGNPSVDQFKDNWDTPTHAFELSPERGRYVHVVSMAEHGTFAITKEWADVAYPDVGVHDGKYYSFFAPGVSYFALPFYLFGRMFGLEQVATFSVESLVSIITLIFIYLVGRRIFSLPGWAALFSVLVYGFSSTSWSYAITLYQNAFTACFIITGFYAAWRFAQNDSRYSWIYAAYVWLAYGLAITVDYPNALLMLPVMIYLAYLTFQFKKTKEGIILSVRWGAIIASIAFLLITGVHLAHNAHNYGAWNKVAGTLPNYRQIATTTLLRSTTGVSTSTQMSFLQNMSATSTPVPVKEKTLVGSFFERNIPNGFYILIFSSERGLFFFTPIFLFSLLGIFYALRKNEEDMSIYIVPLALISVNIFLYSSWGDPWGGWAYGPRYLIASMPWLALFVGIALYHGRESTLKKGIALILFWYSLGVALLGALVTNAIPTKQEGLLLPAKMYNYLLSVDFLGKGKSGSFLYNTYFSAHLSLLEYFVTLYAVVAIMGATILIISVIRHHE